MEGVEPTSGELKHDSIIATKVERGGVQGGGCGDCDLSAIASACDRSAPRARGESPPAVWDNKVNLAPEAAAPRGVAVVARLIPLEAAPRVIPARLRGFSGVNSRAPPASPLPPLADRTAARNAGGGGGGGGGGTFGDAGAPPCGAAAFVALVMSAQVNCSCEKAV